MAIVVKERVPQTLKCEYCKSTLEFTFADCIPITTIKRESSTDYTGGTDWTERKITIMHLICPECNWSNPTNLNPIVYSKEK